MSNPALLVGYDSSDDAAVYRVSDEVAVIETVDFFTPIVDDPYLFGQIAAANALSDVYAMGGEPKLALNIMCLADSMDDKTVREILREPMRHLLSLKKSEQLARASEMLKAVDLDDSVLDKRPPQLSGGQLQRVCLARALAVEPKLLILDEAVSNLDLVLQAGVIRLLKKLQQQFGTACLFITHDLRLVERFCQRVMVMDNGQIVETQVVGEKLTFSSDAGRVLQNAVLPAFPVRRRTTEKV